MDFTLDYEGETKDDMMSFDNDDKKSLKHKLLGNKNTR